HLHLFFTKVDSFALGRRFSPQCPNYRCRALVENDCAEAMADSTKAKVHNIFSVLFNHAVRYEWLKQGRNPITLVRQSAKRQSDPVVLESKEIRAILAQLEPCARLMVMLAVTAGLRRSELVGLKWGDISFREMQISIQRSIYLGVIGKCKTETSR